MDYIQIITVFFVKKEKLKKDSDSKFTKCCTKIPLIPSNHAPACMFVVNGSTSCNQFCRLFSPTNLHLQHFCKVRPEHDKSCTSSLIIVIWVASPCVKDNGFIYSTPSVPQPPRLFYKILLCILWNVKEIYRISSTGAIPLRAQPTTRVSSSSVLTAQKGPEIAWLK